MRNDFLVILFKSAQLVEKIGGWDNFGLYLETAITSLL